MAGDGHGCHRVALGATAAQGATVAGLAKQSPARKVTAIVQFKPGFSERKAKTLVAAHGGKVTSRVPLIHGLAVRLAGQAGARSSPASARSSASPSTRACTAPRSRTARSPTRFPKSINADKVWRRGYTGKGVGVAVIDTGIAGDAVDFKDASGNSRVIANAITSKGATTAGDGFGHGTHVAGIIAGNSLNRPAGDPLRGKYIGVAPDANLIAVKASDEAGNSTVLDVINGIQFVVDHKAEFNIRVAEPVGQLRHPAVLQDSTRSTRPSSTRGRRASSSSPPRATAAPLPTPSSTPRPTTRS